MKSIELDLLNEIRSIAVDRIFGIGDVLNLDSEIIHIAINILDSYVKEWNCPNIQVICVCCIRIAVKFYSDTMKLSYSLLANYISHYSPVKCFIKTEESILIKIDYIIPIYTIATKILEFTNRLDLSKSYNREIRFNIMYIMDYLLFFPKIYYHTRHIVLIVSVILLSIYTSKKKKNLYNEKYPGINMYYRRRCKVLTSKRYINMSMFV